VWLKVMNICVECVIFVENSLFVMQIVNIIFVVLYYQPAHNSLCDCCSFVAIYDGGGH
jgi:hypothetical protein